MMHLESLTLDNFEVFAKLLGGDEFGGCYCAVWRGHDATWGDRCSDPNKPNLGLTRKSVNQGFHVGFLVYEGEGLVGWTGSGSKTSFPFLEDKLGSRLTPFDSKVWSIGCMAIAENYRGQSKSEGIINSVVDMARSNGVEFVEAYPVRPWNEGRSYRGSFSQYQRLGFEIFGSEKDGDSDIFCMRLKI